MKKKSKKNSKRDYQISFTLHLSEDAALDLDSTKSVKDFVAAVADEMFFDGDGSCAKKIVVSAKKPSEKKATKISPKNRTEMFINLLAELNLRPRLNILAAIQKSAERTTEKNSFIIDEMLAEEIDVVYSIISAAR